MFSCLSRCLSAESCVLVRYELSQCKQFKQVEFKDFVSSNGDFLYKKKSINLNKYLHHALKKFSFFISKIFFQRYLSNGLRNYWPFSNNYDDPIGKANLFNGLNYTLTTDRFGNPNSALDLANGYLQVPSGVYFSGKFTFTAWVYMRSFGKYSRLFDFGNGAPMNNVFLAMCNSVDLLPYLNVYSTTSFQDMVLPRDIQVAKLNLFYKDWSHLAVQFDGGSFLFYLNGILTGKRTGASGPPNVNRTLNYFGKSNWVADSNVDAIFDEIRIYDRVLSQSEIFELMLE